MQQSFPPAFIPQPIQNIGFTKPAMSMRPNPMANYIRPELITQKMEEIKLAIANRIKSSSLVLSTKPMDASSHVDAKHHHHYSLDFGTTELKVFTESNKHQEDIFKLSKCWFSL